MVHGYRGLTHIAFHRMDRIKGQWTEAWTLTWHNVTIHRYWMTAEPSTRDFWHWPIQLIMPKSWGNTHINRVCCWPRDIMNFIVWTTGATVSGWLGIGKCYKPLNFAEGERFESLSMDVYIMSFIQFLQRALDFNKDVEMQPMDISHYDMTHWTFQRTKDLGLGQATMIRLCWGPGGPSTANPPEKLLVDTTQVGSSWGGWGSKIEFSNGPAPPGGVRGWSRNGHEEEQGKLRQPSPEPTSFNWYSIYLFWVISYTTYISHQPNQPTN